MVPMVVIAHPSMTSSLAVFLRRLVVLMGVGVVTQSLTMVILVVRVIIIVVVAMVILVVRVIIIVVVAMIMMVMSVPS